MAVHSGIIRVLIQVEGGSQDRHEYDEKTLEYRAKIHMSRAFPYPYGFVIGTSAADGACVDCYIISRAGLKAGSIVECNPLGLLEQYENGEVDHKVLTVLPQQEVVIDQNVFSEVRNFVAELIARFPEVEIRFGRILSRDEALRHIQEHKDCIP